MTPTQVNRYARHLVLKEIGGPGQQSLLSARIAIVGAGGLGGPAALYLAAAGIGHITIIDDDVVDMSNLQRQIQFKESDIGVLKAKVLMENLSAINSGGEFSAVKTRLNKDNCQALLSGYDIIMDGTDNFETRLWVNEAALALSTPLVSGALGRFDGQVSVFASDGTGPCYRCLVPDVPPHAQTCSEVGVVGALAGIIGSMMALEALKHITSAGQTLAGRLWIYDGLAAQSRTVTLPKDPDCAACGQYKA